MTKIAMLVGMLLVAGCSAAVEREAAPEPASGKAGLEKPCQLVAQDGVCSDSYETYLCSMPVIAYRDGSNVTNQSHAPSHCYASDETDRHYCCQAY